MSLKFATPAPSADSQMLLVRAMLESSVQNAPDQEIVCGSGTRYTYRELSARVARLASGLHGLGIAEGDTVAVMDWESHRYLEAYFAIPMTGAVLQTVNVRLSPAQISFCLASTGAKAILYHPDFCAIVEYVRAELDDAIAWIAIAPRDESGTADHDLERILSAADQGFAFPDFDENALGTTFHTTGTTGQPKAVQFSHRQIVLHSLATMAALATQPTGQGFRRGDVYMPLTPMFHVHAWGIPFVATLTGTRQVYPGRYDAAEIVRLKLAEGVSFSHCVPTVLQMVLDEADRRQVSLSPWTMVIGGAALHTDLHMRAKDAGVTAITGYGMSESCPIISLARHEPETGEQAAESLCKAGHAVPLVLADIQDERGRSLPHDGTKYGELVLRAPWLTRGYGNDGPAGEELWRGGVLHTQDVASMDRDGTLVIRDRLKDLIKSGGEWISSAQVEELIARHPDVKEVAVIGRPDPVWTERPVAFVSLSEGAVILRLATLIDHLAPFVENGRIPKYALPDALTVLGCLPRTSVGKIDKKALREISA